MADESPLRRLVGSEAHRILGFTRDSIGWEALATVVNRHYFGEHTTQTLVRPSTIRNHYDGTARSVARGRERWLVVVALLFRLSEDEADELLLSKGCPPLAALRLQLTDQLDITRIWSLAWLPSEGHEEASCIESPPVEVTELGSGFNAADTEYGDGRHSAIQAVREISAATVDELAVAGRKHSEVGGGFARFDEGLYVTRSIEQALLAAGTGTVAIVGEAGNGKTSILWALQQRLTAAGRPAFLLRATSWQKDERLRVQLNTATGYLASIGQTPTVLLDMVDVLLHDAGERDGFVMQLTELRAVGAAVVLATRPIEARFLPRDVRQHRLDGFGDEELDAALQRYRSVFAATARSEESFEELVNAVRWDTPILPLLRRPLTLRMLFEVYSPDELPPELSTFDLFRAFWSTRVRSDSRSPLQVDTSSADLGATTRELAVEMLARGSPVLPLDAIETGEEPISLGHIGELRSRGVLSVNSSNVEFFHQSFFEHAAARAIVDHRKPHVAQALYERGCRYPDDAFLWPVIEQAALWQLSSGSDPAGVVKTVLSWRDIESSAAFSALLGVWTQTTELPGLTGWLGEMLASTTSPEGRPQQVLSLLRALPTSRSAEVFELVGAAWSCPQPGRRLAALAQTPLLARRSPARLLSFMRKHEVIAKIVADGLYDNVRDLAKALAILNESEPEAAAALAAEFMEAVGDRSDGQLRRHLYALLAEGDYSFDPERALATLIEPLAGLGRKVTYPQLVPLVRRIAEALGLSAEQALRKAAEADDTLTIPWLEAACSLIGEQPSPVGFIDSVFALPPWAPIACAQSLANVASTDPVVAADLLERARQALADTGNTPDLEVVARVLALTPQPQLAAILDRLPGGLDDQVWTDDRRLGRLAVAAAVVGHDQATRAVELLLNSGDDRSRSRLTATLARRVGHDERVRPWFEQLVIEQADPNRLVAALKDDEIPSEARRGLEVFTVTLVRRLCSSIDLSDRVKGMRFRRYLLEQSVSIEHLFDEPSGMMNSSAHQSLAQHLFVVLSHRLDRRLSDPSDVLAAARNALYRGWIDSDTVLTAIEAQARVGQPSEAASGCVDLIVAYEPIESRHLRGARPALQALADLDPEAALRQISRLAEAFGTMGDKARKYGARELYDPIVRVFAATSVRSVGDTIIEYARIDADLAGKSIEAAAQALGLRFLELGSRLLDTRELSRSLKDQIGGLLQEYQRPLGSKAWPDLRTLR